MDLGTSPPGCRRGGGGGSQVQLAANTHEILLRAPVPSTYCDVQTAEMLLSALPGAPCWRSCRPCCLARPWARRTWPFPGSGPVCARLLFGVTALLLAAFCVIGYWLVLQKRGPAMAHGAAWRMAHGAGGGARFYIWYLVVGGT
jgi:hypothetical protein